MKKLNILVTFFMGVIFVASTFVSTPAKAQEMNLVIDNMPRLLGVGLV